LCKKWSQQLFEEIYPEDVVQFMYQERPPPGYQWFISEVHQAITIIPEKWSVRESPRGFQVYKGEYRSDNPVPFDVGVSVYNYHMPENLEYFDEFMNGIVNRLKDRGFATRQFMFMQTEMDTWGLHCVDPTKYPT
jgi:hypothetical protein